MGSLNKKGDGIMVNFKEKSLGHEKKFPRGIGRGTRTLKGKNQNGRTGHGDNQVEFLELGEKL